VPSWTPKPYCCNNFGVSPTLLLLQQLFFAKYDSHTLGVARLLCAEK